MCNFNKCYLYFILSFLIFLSSCKNKEWIVKEYSSTKIAIDSSKESIANKEYMEYLQPFKQAIDEQMSVVIGKSVQALTVSRPESLLSNFSADVYSAAASKYLGEKVNIGIVNIGGIRAEIPKGDITIGNIFRVMPFENELVILWLKGDKVEDLCHVFAQVGGEGVSGIQMGIKEGKAVSILVNGETIDKEKIYTIATNDYLAGGNDKMVQLAEHEKRVDTGIKVRNALIDYIKEETKNNRVIDARLEKRIYFIK